MMTRTKLSTNGAPKDKVGVLTQVITDILSRTTLAKRLGYQYGDKRKVYEALGYPDEKDLTFEYYYNKYDRQDIATAIIDRPTEATWKGDITIVEEGKDPKDSSLAKAWKKLNKDLKVKSRLMKIDKLAAIGQYSVILLGFNDVKKKEDFKNPAKGTKKLLYVRQAAESEAWPEEWESDTSNPRYGLVRTYKIRTGSVQSVGGTIKPTQFEEIVVHHSRVIHVVQNNLTSEMYGTPVMKPIVNRLVDLEKILGGSAEIYWRGARPGYTATAQPDYEMSTQEEDALQDTLDLYEHDLRRFLSVKGVDIKAMEQQIADPLNHIDAQLQAISAETGIPKRVLIGSERGELASSQDADQWLTLVKTRQEELAEPMILRPFIDRCMEMGILPKVVEYNVLWEDVFAPSEADKAKVGVDRSAALKTYAESPFASEILPPPLAFKYLLGLDDNQIEEAMSAIDLEAIMEEKELAKERMAALPLPGENGTPQEEEEELEEN